MIVVWLFLAMPRDCLQFVIVVFPDQTHLLFFTTEDHYLSHDYADAADCDKLPSEALPAKMQKCTPVTQDFSIYVAGHTKTTKNLNLERQLAQK